MPALLVLLVVQMAADTVRSDKAELLIADVDVPGGPPAPRFEFAAGFSAKSGYRLVFFWNATGPLVAQVEWGFTEERTRVAKPFVQAADSAGFAVADLDRAEFAPGRVVHFRVADARNGTASEPRSFALGNAWTSDARDGAYEVNLLAQLDTNALPEGTPADQGLLEAAAAVDVAAERLYDAADGYLRLGTVLLTDTVLDHPVASPLGPVVDVHASHDGRRVGTCGDPGTATVDGTNAQPTVADVLFSVAGATNASFGAGVPAIDTPCEAVPMGRLRTSETNGTGDLHAGFATARGLARYAVGLDDLGTGGADCWVGTEGTPGIDAWAFDVSMMNAKAGWNGTRWVGSELDRGPTTPCDYGQRRASWPLFTTWYPRVPTLGRTGDGLPYHLDSYHDLARGNPDGGRFEVFVLDQHPPQSRLVRFLGPG